jgi:hypothetical protein
VAHGRRWKFPWKAVLVHLVLALGGVTMVIPSVDAFDILEE